MNKEITEDILLKAGFNDVTEYSNHVRYVRYKMERKEDYADIDSVFTQLLHPAKFKKSKSRIF